MRFGVWNNAYRLIFLEQLATYLSAGIPLDRALAIITEALPRRLRPQIESIRNDVISGRKMSARLCQLTGISASLTGLIEHGESSGSLATSLEAARQVIERTTDMSKKSLSAIIYPAVIGCFSIILIIGLVRGVMPQITPMLKSLSVPLPILTRIMMKVSDIVIHDGLWITIGFVMIMVIAVLGYRYSVFLRHIAQSIVMSLPIVGRGVTSYTYSVFFRSFGSLIDSGVSVPAAFDRTVDTVSLLPIRRLLMRQAIHIRSGVRLSHILGNMQSGLQPYAASLVSAGEISGSLGRSLIRCADLIDRDLEHLIKRLTSLIEPLMMAGMGGAVGSIALSIMMPIYDISKTLQY